MIWYTKLQQRSQFYHTMDFVVHAKLAYYHPLGRGVALEIRKQHLLTGTLFAFISLNKRGFLKPDTLGFALILNCLQGIHSEKVVHSTQLATAYSLTESLSESHFFMKVANAYC